MGNQDKPKRQRGCLFYGCLIGTVCLGAVLLALLLGLYEVRKMILQFTDSQPLPLPTLSMSQAEMEKVQQRFDGFLDSVRVGRQTQSLVLTGDELNALLATEPGVRGLKGKLYVSIEGDRLKAQLSLRMSDVGLPFFRGRYLNGTATLGLSLQNGSLQLAPETITVKGKPLPSVYMNRIQGQDFTQGLTNNPRASAVLDHLQSIEVKDGTIVLVPKQ
jgi:hypothetical protein